MTLVNELPHNLKGFALTSPIKQWLVPEVIAPFSQECDKYLININKMN